MEGGMGSREVLPGFFGHNHTKNEEFMFSHSPTNMKQLNYKGKYRGDVKVKLLH